MYINKLVQIFTMFHKMRVALAVLVLVGVVVGDLSPQVGYHDAVGIPLAQHLKETEEAIFAANKVSVNNPNNRIVGGAVSGFGAHPYLGGLLITFLNLAGQSVCGSSLLNTNRLVTAAHCWFDGNRQAIQLEVVLGSEFVFFGGTRIVTNQVVTHSLWNPSTLENDIAMIYLPQHVAFTQSIQPINLPSNTWDTFAGSWAIAAGYGKTSDAQTGVTTTTQVSHVNLQVMTHVACASIWGTWIRDSTVCTSGAGGVGICGGDSGGPLLVVQNGQNVLVGISSFVAQNANGGTACQGGFPSAFARVTSFHSFILQHLW